MKVATIGALAAAALLAGRAAEDRKPPADDRPDAGSKDAGTPDPDREIIDHLDELQDLELLQNLELFDTARDGEK